MPRKPNPKPRIPLTSPARLQGDPFQACHSNPKAVKETQRSEGWRLLTEDLKAWREREVGNLTSGRPLTEQQMGQIQGVIKFIDILLRG